MSKIETQREQLNQAQRQIIDQALEALGNVKTALKLISEGPLTPEMYSKLNEDGGMDTLLDTVILDSELNDATECAKIRTKITNALQEAWSSNIKELRAALECYTTDILAVLQAYDAHHEQDAKIRASLSEFEARFDDAAKDKLAATVMEYECFNFSNAEAVCEMLIEVGEFLTNNCNYEILGEISKMDGADMSDDQKMYLNNLLEKVNESKFGKEDWFDVAMQDRINGLTFEKLGFDAKAVVKIAKILTKAESKFIKTSRDLREAIVRDTETSENIAIKNTLFYDVMDKLCHFVMDGSKCRNYLSEQINLMAGHISSIAAGTPSEEGQKAKALERGDDTEFEEGGAAPEDPNSDEPGQEPVDPSEK